MKDKAIVIFERQYPDSKKCVDVEVPLDISANELVTALNQTYRLGINIEDIKQCYIRCERPTVLLRGDRTLRDFGVREGTIMHFSLRGTENGTSV